jgi:hypothetical protein
VPVCSVCGQAEHAPSAGVLEHCYICRQPVYAGTSYWIHRRAYALTDRYFCEDCVTWNRTGEELARRAAGLMRRGSRR